MMEFEDMRKIWDEQKGESMYVIDETALHTSVTRKKDATSRRINRLEMKASIINGIGAILVLVIAPQRNFYWALGSSGLFAAAVVYIQYLRWKRKKGENRFDQSLLGELDHAISNANSIIKFNTFLVAGVLIPVFVLNFSKMIVRGAQVEKWIITAGMCLLALFLTRWEQKRCNIPRKKQLLDLKMKLTAE
jgi:hypothetical protein